MEDTLTMFVLAVFCLIICPVEAGSPAEPTSGNIVKSVAAFLVRCPLESTRESLACT